MTILTPSVLPEAPAAAPLLTAPSTVPSAPFDLLMAAELPASPADPEQPDVAPDSTAAAEQAGVLAACMTWAPTPLTPPAHVVIPEGGSSALVSGDGFPDTRGGEPTSTEAPHLASAPMAMPASPVSPAVNASAFSVRASEDRSESVLVNPESAPVTSSEESARVRLVLSPRNIDQFASTADAPLGSAPTQLETALPPQPGQQPELASVETTTEPPQTDPGVFRAAYANPTAPAVAASTATSGDAQPEPRVPASPKLAAETQPIGEAGKDSADAAFTDSMPAVSENSAVRPAFEGHKRARVVRPELRAAYQEKSAESVLPDRAPLEKPGLEESKTFVSATAQGARVEEEIVGTGVAKTAPDMSSVPSDHSLHLPRTATSMLTESPAARFDGAATPDVQPAARDTVAKVLSVIDAQEHPAATNRRSVAMDFDFGGERLAVRVELRDGTVRAQFHASSPELRSAIASEWSQAIAARSSSLRAVEPEFVATAPQGQNAFTTADDHASRQQSRQPQSEPGALPVRRFAERPATVTQAAPENQPRYHQSFTTRHLHTFA